VGLERGPHSLVSTIEELLGRNNSGSGLESREYGRRDSLHWPRGTLYPQNLALTSPKGGGHSFGIVRSRTKGMEFVFTCRKSFSASSSRVGVHVSLSQSEFFIGVFCSGLKSSSSGYSAVD
jgi:hypothetical protein